MFQTIYTKYSNERAPEFSVSTMIMEDEKGNRIVRKKAATKAALVHLDRIEALYGELTELYKGSGISVNRCTREGNTLDLEFLEGHTYEADVDQILIERGPEEAIEAIGRYLDRMIPEKKMIPFVMTEEFVRVFGQVPDFPEGTMSLTISDIDMIMANMMLTGERLKKGIAGAFQKKTLIDYEWSFHFPIPVHYLAYRIIHYYVEREEFRQILKERDIFGRFGISQDERVIFLQMEMAFQRYTEGVHVAAHTMYEQMSPGVCQTSIYTARTKGHMRKGWLHVFWTNDGVHRIDDSYRTIFTDGEVNITLPVPAGQTQLRIDPGEDPCIVRIRRITPVSKEDQPLKKSWLHQERDRHVEWTAGTAITSNGRRAGDCLLAFEAPDPQIYVDLTAIAAADGAEEMIKVACDWEIAMEVLWLGPDVLTAVVRGAESCGCLEEAAAEVRIQEQIIERGRK